MAKPFEQRYRAWDKKLGKMRTVMAVSPDRKYVTFKNKPSAKVPSADVEILMHMGIAGENRKGIYEGDIVTFPEGDNSQIGVVVRTEKGEWVIKVSKSSREVPFPWNDRDKISVLGNRYENKFYLSDEYARMAHVGEIRSVLSSYDICMDKYCGHDLERAIEGLSDLNKDELVEMVKSLSESLRYYTRSYFEECSRNRNR